MYKIFLLLLILAPYCFAQTQYMIRNDAGSLADWGAGGAEHLQGLAVNADTIYMSYTTTLVKAKISNGDTLISLVVDSHAGGIAFVDDTLYVPNVKGHIRKYDRDLVLLDSSSVAGQLTQIYAVAYANNKFYIAGTMSADSTINRVYEYDRNFNFLKRYGIETGYQQFGIQCMEYWRDKFYIGCYSDDAGTIPIEVFQCDSDLVLLRQTDPLFGDVEGAYGMAVTDDDSLFLGYKPRHWSGVEVRSLVYAEDSLQVCNQDGADNTLATSMNNTFMDDGLFANGTGYIDSIIVTLGAAATADTLFFGSMHREPHTTNWVLRDSSYVVGTGNDNADVGFSAPADFDKLYVETGDVIAIFSPTTNGLSVRRDSDPASLMRYVAATNFLSADTTAIASTAYTNNLAMKFLGSLGQRLFVAPTGNDANSGIWTTDPWKTMSNINTGTFNPRDSVVFELGNTWTDSLVVPSDSMYIGVYGTGSRVRVPYITNEKNGVTISNGIYFNGWTWDYTTFPRDSTETARGDSLQVIDNKYRPSRYKKAW